MKATLADLVPKRHGRRRPYTQAGIRRIPCFRCGQKAEHQWSICADGNLQRPVCTPCDVELNRLVLEWARDPEASTKVARYAEAMESRL